MDQNDITETEQKPLSVLERFRQLSREKEQQPEAENVKVGGDVGVTYFKPDTSSKSAPCNEKDSDTSPKETIFRNKGRDFRGRGGRSKRTFDRENKPAASPRLKGLHQGLLESEIGITEYITPGAGFKGIIKQRFSDFQVNEIDLAGNFVMLTNTDIPVEKDSDEEPILEDEFLSLLTQEQWDDLTEMYNTKQSTGPVRIDVTDVNKEIRNKIHKAIKIKYGAHIFSNTVDQDDRKFMEIGLATNTDRRVVWPRNRGEYLHFVIHKENTDTTETIHALAQHLRVKSNKFSYAGTKDKRAVTSQKMCVRRIIAEKLKGLHLRNIYIGNFEYKWNDLRLGDLKGNRFKVALREVDADDDVIKNAMISLKEKGFINYFGNQRFGSSAVAPTHMIGKAIVQSDWKQAVELILKPRPNERGYPDLSAARETWWKTKDAKQALKRLHYKDKTIEGKVLQGLDMNGPTAYVNALQNLPKNTVTLYAHAYQSLMWNKVISRRVKEFGFIPLAGDMVFEDKNSDIVDNEHVEVIENDNTCETEEKEGEDSGDQRKDEHIRKKLNVRVLSEEEAKEASIFDIIYPLPGCDIIYPNNVTAQWYSELLAEDGLTSETLRQNNRWFTLLGSYRKILNKPMDVVWKTLHYNNLNTDLMATDRGKLNGLEDPVDIPEGKYKALIIEFSLVPAAYATMALREVLKCETGTSHQAAMTAKSLINEESSNKEENQVVEMGIIENKSVGESNENAVESAEPANKKQKVEEINPSNENER